MGQLITVKQGAHDDEVADFVRNNPEATDFLRLHSELKKANNDGKALYEALLRDLHVMTVRAETAEAELLRTRVLLDASQRARFALQAHMEVTAQTAIAGLAAAKNEELETAAIRGTTAIAASGDPIQFGRNEGDAITGTRDGS